MKNKKLTLVTSLILAIVMLFSSVSIGAYGIETTTEVTTEPTTTQLEETTTALPEETTTAVVEETTTEAPAEETTTETAEETTEAPAEEETTTEPETDDDYSDVYWEGYEEGYYDGYDEGYTDGFWDGYYDYDSGDDYSEGYWDGYYEGYYDAMNNGGNVITIFDRWDAFYADLIDRLLMLKETFIDYIYMIFKLGDYGIDETAEIDDTSFIPDGTQPTLEDSEEAAVICEEFNELLIYFNYGDHPDLYMTRTFDTIVNLVDCSGGFIVKKMAQNIIDENIVQSSFTEYYDDGEWMYPFVYSYLYPEGLTSAEKTVNDDGSIDYKFVLIEEASFFDGYNTYAVKLNKNGKVVRADDFYHDYLTYTLSVEDLYVDPAVVTRAEIQYPGATVTAKVDAEGRLVNYNIEMPVKGSGEGKISFVKLDATLEGSSNLYYSFDYDV